MKHMNYFFNKITYNILNLVDENENITMSIFLYLMFETLPYATYTTILRYVNILVKKKLIIKNKTNTIEYNLIITDKGKEILNLFKKIKEVINNGNK